MITNPVEFLRVEEGVIIARNLDLKPKTVGRDTLLESGRAVFSVITLLTMPLQQNPGGPDQKTSALPRTWWAPQTLPWRLLHR